MKGTMHVMDQTGDTEITWETDDAASVKQAEKVFNDFISRNHTAYKLERAKSGAKPAQGNEAPTNGTPAGNASVDGELIKTFDPEAGTIIIAVPLIGG